ncbi:MAG: hypothetical protein J1F69_05055 [Clostridiales bacterium]|nr:hypothetical protein [Clostridiales bacterium]
MVFFETLIKVILEPICYLLTSIPTESSDNTVPKKKSSGIKIIVLVFLISIVLIFMLGAIIAGIVLLAGNNTEEDKAAGLLFLIIGLFILVAYSVTVTIRLIVKRKRKNNELITQHTK